ncbi:MAG: hypothetical protein ABW321_05580 [Polyangiales bacterium]
MLNSLRSLVVLTLCLHGASACSSESSATRPSTSTTQATTPSSGAPATTTGASAGQSESTPAAGRPSADASGNPAGGASASAAGNPTSPAGAGGAVAVPAPGGSAGSTPPDAGEPAADAGPADAGPSPGAGTACDRACLMAISDAYLDALVARDATKLATAPTVRFTENGKELALTEGLWAVAQRLGDYRQDFAEVPAGQTAGFVSLEDDAGDVLLAFRLKVVDQQVTEIETTVCRRGEATFFSPANLSRNPIFDEVSNKSPRATRDELIAVVDPYFKGIETSDGSAIKLESTARRNENGTNTGSGMGLQNVAMFSYIDTIERRYVLVDEERAVVLPWVLFQIPMGLGGSRTLHLAEAFKVSDNGNLADIQAIMVNQPLGTPGGWE